MNALASSIESTQKFSINLDCKRRKLCFELAGNISRVGIQSIEQTPSSEKMKTSVKQLKMTPHTDSLPNRASPALNIRNGMFCQKRSQTGDRFWWTGQVESSDETENSETKEIDECTPEVVYEAFKEHSLFYDKGELFGFDYASFVILKA